MSTATSSPSRARWATARGSAALFNLGELAEQDGDLERAAALFLHAERIFHDLHSVCALAAAAAAQHLAERVGPERWDELQAAAEQARWEEIVG